MKQEDMAILLQVNKSRKSGLHIQAKHRLKLHLIQEEERILNAMD